MKKAIAAQLQKIQRSAKGRTTGFAIGNTSDLFPSGCYYEMPIRETSEFIYGGVVVRDVDTAKAAAALVQGKVDYVFADDEKKVRKIYYGANDDGNIEKAVHGVLTKSPLISYKGNDLAVEAVDVLVRSLVPSLRGNIIAVIGAGNLGSKIALKLVERGENIKVYRRDRKKLTTIVAGINTIKSQNTHAKVTAAPNIAAACRDAYIIIGATNEKGVITKDMIPPAKNPVLIDVGKGCFADDVVADPTYRIYRVDVSIIQKYFFYSLVQAHEHFKKKMDRKFIPAIRTTIITMGLLARKGEVIVDDIDHPTQVVGISAGKGVLEKNTPRVQRQIDTVQKFFKIK